MSNDNAPSTVKAYLRPIDRDGLLGFAEKVVQTQHARAPIKCIPCAMVNIAP